MSHPLILTLQIDERAQAHYDALRRRYFPPERNLIPAHLTLFHQLPDGGGTYDTLREAAQVSPRIELVNPTLRSLGRGVAVYFQSERLTSLHAALSLAFKAHLTPQDRQRFQPHIVVQNKVAPDTARHTLVELKSEPLIEPRAVGLTVWRYLGGPWEHLCDHPFADS